MIKLVYCVRKRSDISDGHAKAIGADRYVQSHTLDSEINQGFRESRGTGPAYDGITEMWWSDIEVFQKVLGIPQTACRVSR